MAHAGSKDDAAAVIAKWTKAFAEGDVDAIARLYAPDALMIGTNGKAVLTRPDEIHGYFDGAFKRFGAPRTVTLDSSKILAVDDNTVVLTGFDTIAGVTNGQPIISKGRVTFVVAKRGADWMIVHLHRSPLPQT